jgi:HSP20 family protein
MTGLPIKRIGRRGMGRLQKDMDDLLSDFFEDWDIPFTKREFWPAVDVADKDDSILVKAEVPGCKAEDISLAVHGNTLTISGRKEEQTEKKEEDYYRLERRYGDFKREIKLPAEVDVDKVEAVCRDGVLTVTLPKIEKAPVKKIEVKG